MLPIALCPTIIHKLNTKTFNGWFPLSSTDTHDSKPYSQSTPQSEPMYTPDYTTTLSDDIHTATVVLQPHEHIVQEIVGINEKEETLERNLVQPRIPTVLQLTHESIQTSDIVTLEMNDNYEPKQNVGSVASNSYSTSHALQVSETSVQQTTVQYESKHKSPTDDQKQMVVESYAIEVSNPIINEKESPLDVYQPQTMKCAALSMVTSEHVSTVETHSGESTTKFYPEVIVATEVAHTNVKSLNEYNTEIANIVEPQTEFVVSTPKSQNAMETLFDHNHIFKTEPLVEEGVQILSDIPQNIGTGITSLVENTLVQSYENVAMEGEEIFRSSQSDVKQAVPEYNVLPVASIETPFIQQQEAPVPIPREMQQKVAIVSVDGSKRVAYNLEETNVFESVTHTKPMQPEHQSAVFKTSEQSTHIAAAIEHPTFIGKLFINILYSTHKHNITYLTCRHTTHTSKTHHTSY